MSAAQRAYLDFQRDIARQNAEWKINRERLRELPADLRIRLSEAIVCELDAAAEGGPSAVLVEPALRV